MDHHLTSAWLYFDFFSCFDVCRVDLCFCLILSFGVSETYQYCDHHLLRRSFLSERRGKSVDHHLILRIFCGPSFEIEKKICGPSVEIENLLWTMDHHLRLRRKIVDHQLRWRIFCGLGVFVFKQPSKTMN